jgi:hypothetical protein
VPGSGSKVIRPSSTGLPSRSTIPETVGAEFEHPHEATSATMKVADFS